MGVLTATFGGVIRDVLAHEPSVLLQRELYVTPALAGAAAFVGAGACGRAGHAGRRSPASRSRSASAPARSSGSWSLPGFGGPRTGMSRRLVLVTDSAASLGVVVGVLIGDDARPGRPRPGARPRHAPAGRPVGELGHARAEAELHDGLIVAGSVEGADGQVDLVAPISKVSGVPQSPQKPRWTLLELWKRFALAAGPGRASPSRTETTAPKSRADRLLAHAAMADAWLARVAVDAEADRAALAAAGRSSFRRLQHRDPRQGARAVVAGDRRSATISPTARLARRRRSR